MQSLMKTTKVKEAQPMGEYIPTSVDKVKENADILIEYANGGSYTINTKGVELSGRGVKFRYSNGNYEVTTKRLEKLQSSYKVVPNF